MRKQRSVAIVHQLIVLHAAALVLLAGCQKPPQSGQTIRFTAVSQPSALTKVQYTGELSGTTERIDWKQGDAIRIYSEGATASNDPSYPWADYAVTADGTADGAKSKASISVSSPQGGLTWGAGDNTFYAIYPSPGGSADVAGTVRGTSGTPFNCTVPAAQEGTAIFVKDLSDQSSNIYVYYPTNASAYHLAYASMLEPAAEAQLEFKPAYTAFHISAGHNGTDPAITVKSVTLKAASGNAVAGDFTAYRDGASWTFGCPVYASGSNDAVTFSFPAGSYPVLNSSTSKLELVLYALPQDLTNLTLDFLVDVAGVGTDLHRKLDLKMAAAGDYHGHTYSAGDWLIFNKCNKSYIKGLLVPGSVWTVDDATVVKMQESVEDWTDADSSLEYDDTDPVVNASKIAAGGSAGNYNFSVYAPKGQNWKIQVLDGIAGSPVSSILITQNGNYNNGDPISSSASGTLTGEIGNPAKIDFTLSGGSGTFWLSFSIIAGGMEYSINSEVTENLTNTPMEITL